nr:MAG TPA: hypothetical protein [Caudoviricetes sp.]
MHTLECNAKIPHHPIYGNAFDKTSVNKTKRPAMIRIVERPGGFVDVIIPQIVQKEKRQALE